MEGMQILVTGGCGFIGRWVVKMLLDQGMRVVVLDDLSFGRLENIEEFSGNPNLTFIRGAFQDDLLVMRLFQEEPFAVCFHLAANTRVRESLLEPERMFECDLRGTFTLLETCRNHGIRFVFMSSASVYRPSSDWAGIQETHPTLPTSPFEAYKIAGENLTLSFWHAYGLPVTILRPFDTYGPFQRPNSEGSVVAEFFQQRFEGKPILVEGDGTATRDLMEVTDCARFVIQAGLSDATIGEILNAGSGRDVTLDQLAGWVAEGEVPICHVPHPDPPREIKKRLCSYRKVRELLGWRPMIRIEAGLQILDEWLRHRQGRA